MVAGTMGQIQAQALTLAALRATLQLSREKLARVLQVSAKTVERWEARETLPQAGLAGERIAALRQVQDLGARILTPEGFARFLQTPLAEFGHRTPLLMIERGEAEAVIGVLASLDAGTGY